MVDSRDDSQGSAAVAPDDLNAPLGLGKFAFSEFVANKVGVLSFATR